MADFASEVPASLLKLVTPDETAAEFFRRQGREAVATGLSFIDAHIKLRPGHILELSGPAGSGKTELLVQVRVISIH
jgi:ABC-type lipoprotein export system ATPase subunit